MSGKLEQVLELMDESHRLWENGSLDDALSIMEAAVDLMPELPDPWIDIAGILRAKNNDHKNEDLELRALDADRKLISLGADEPELLVDVTLARRRIAHREAWNKHLQKHLEEEAEKEKQEKEEQARKQEANALWQAENEKRAEAIGAEMRKKRKEAEKALQAARDASWKSLSWFEKRQAKKSMGVIARSTHDPNHPMAMKAKWLEHEIEQLRKSYFAAKDLADPNRPISYVPGPPDGLSTKMHVELRIAKFDAQRHAGAQCICGVSLNDNPPKE